MSETGTQVTEDTWINNQRSTVFFFFLSPNTLFFWLSSDGSHVMSSRVQLKLRTGAHCGKCVRVCVSLSQSRNSFSWENSKKEQESESERESDAAREAKATQAKPSQTTQPANARRVYGRRGHHRQLAVVVFSCESSNINQTKEEGKKEESSTVTTATATVRRRIRRKNGPVHSG
jgi:hypothetical protein